VEKGELDPPLMEFGKGRFMSDTLRAFGEQKLEPYEYPKKRELDLVLLLPKGDKRIPTIMKIYDSLSSGGGDNRFFRSYFPGFKSVFNVKLSLKTTSAYESETQAKSKINEIKRIDSDNPTILIVVIKERTSGCGLYQKLKIHTIRQDITSQFLTMTTADKYESGQPSDKGEILWNLGMGLFSKMKVYPWKLRDPLEGVAAVIGLSTMAESSEGIVERKGISIVQIFNNWGNPTGRFLGSHHNLQREKGVWSAEEPEDEFGFLSEGLKLIDNHVLDANHAKKNQIIVVHMTDLYSNTILDEIQKRIAESEYENFRIIRIQDKGSYKKFNPSKAKQQAWPNQGYYSLDKKKNRASLFTKGKWQYYTQKYTIESDNIIPLGVELLRAPEGIHLETTDLSHIYQLTRLNYGTADVVRVGQPISLKFSKKSAELAMCGLTDIDYDMNHLY